MDFLVILYNSYQFPLPLYLQRQLSDLVCATSSPQGASVRGVPVRFHMATVGRSQSAAYTVEQPCAPNLAPDEVSSRAIDHSLVEFDVLPPMPRLEETEESADNENNDEHHTNHEAKEERDTNIRPCKVPRYSDVMVLCVTCGSRTPPGFQYCGVCTNPLPAQPLHAEAVQTARAAARQRAEETRAKQLAEASLQDKLFDGRRLSPLHMEQLGLRATTKGSVPSAKVKRPRHPLRHEERMFIKWWKQAILKGGCENISEFFLQESDKGRRFRDMLLGHGVTLASLPAVDEQALAANRNMQPVRQAVQAGAIPEAMLTTDFFRRRTLDKAQAVRAACQREAAHDHFTQYSRSHEYADAVKNRHRLLTDGHVDGRLLLQLRSEHGADDAASEY